MTKISVLIPAYQESAILPHTVKRLLAQMEKLGQSFEIIICDDGSKDDTVSVIEALGYPQVRCVTGAHLGKGGSLARGMMEATGELVFYTDADLAYGTAVIPRFLSVLEKREADVVVGSRALHKAGYAGYSFGRRLFSKGYRQALRILGGIRVTDAQCGCKAYTQKAAKALFYRISEHGFAFEFETLLRAEKQGLCVRELPVKIVKNGTSHVRPLRDGLLMLRAAIRIKKKYK
ncbi:MAG: glycosyltransferase family 2 protein [Ruminococcaceae bacterium]|nr:glycosyltransferase family 2 protein [Oscillospiraceae bacterium]